MTHFEGLADEGLPLDEKVLSLNEQDELTDLFLGIQERHGAHGGRDRSHLDKETLKAVQGGGECIREAAVDAMKSAVLGRRRQS